MKTKLYNLKNNQKVGYLQMVIGRSRGPVQLFVHSNDNKWHLQKPVLSLGGIFAVPIFFGKFDGPTPRQYELAVVNTNKRMASPVDVLPEGVTTKIKLFKR